MGTLLEEYQCCHISKIMENLLDAEIGSIGDNDSSDASDCHVDDSTDNHDYKNVNESTGEEAVGEGEEAICNKQKGKRGYSGNGNVGRKKWKVMEETGNVDGREKRVGKEKKVPEVDDEIGVEEPVVEGEEKIMEG